MFLAPLQALAAEPPQPLLWHVAQRLEQGQTLRITAFGSSSTEGIGATSKAKCYPRQLETDLSAMLPHPVLVLNRGIGGEDVDDMMKRLSAIIAEKPDVVIWQTGSNDALRGVDLQHFITDTRAGIAQMQTAGIDVILMEPQLSGRLKDTGQGDVFRDAVRSLGLEMAVPVVRRYDLMRQWLASGELTYEQMMSGDRLHMTDDGYAHLARAVADLIMADIPNPVARRNFTATQTGSNGQTSR
jgi:lysophospholipase L1-like esterase